MHPDLIRQMLLLMLLLLLGLTVRPGAEAELDTAGVRQPPPLASGLRRSREGLI